METLHLRAQPDTISLIMDVVNKASQSGQEIEILDETTYDKEQKMISLALLQENTDKTYEHDDVWSKVLCI